MVPNGHAMILEEEAVRYESFIQSLGGIDLQLLGIGHNGHIGFNEPTDNFPATVHTVQLTESTTTRTPFVRAPRGCADAGHHHGHRHHYEGEEDSSHRRPG